MLWKDDFYLAGNQCSCFAFLLAPKLCVFLRAPLCLVSTDGEEANQGLRCDCTRIATRTCDCSGRRASWPNSLPPPWVVTQNLGGCFGMEKQLSRASCRCDGTSGNPTAEHSSTVKLLRVNPTRCSWCMMLVWLSPSLPTDLPRCCLQPWCEWGLRSREGPASCRCRFFSQSCIHEEIRTACQYMCITAMNARYLHTRTGTH